MSALSWRRVQTQPPYDEITDLMAGYGAAIGPADGTGFSWQVIGPDARDVADGTVSDRDAAKAAVQAWWDQSVDYSAGRTSVPPAGLEAGPWRRCSYCGKSMPVDLVEPVNSSPALACKAVTACQMRQADRDPVTELLGLLRTVEKELPALTTRELAELDYDLRGGHPRDWADGFVGALRVQLGSRGGSAEAIRDVTADRLARKRRRAALKGAETRRQNTAGQS